MSIHLKLWPPNFTVSSSSSARIGAVGAIFPLARSRNFAKSSANILPSLDDAPEGGNETSSTLWYPFLGLKVEGAVNGKDTGNAPAGMV